RIGCRTHLVSVPSISALIDEIVGIPKPFRGALTRLLGIDQLERIYHSTTEGRAIPEQLLDKLAVTYRVSELDLQQVPRTGATAAVAWSSSRPAKFRTSSRAREWSRIPSGTPWSHALWRRYLARASLFQLCRSTFGDRIAFYSRPWECFTLGFARHSWRASC